MNTNDNHNIYNTNNKDPRSVKQQKLRLMSAATPIICQGHILELHIKQLSSLVTLLTAISEIDDTQP